MMEDTRESHKHDTTLLKKEDQSYYKRSQRYQQPLKMLLIFLIASPWLFATLCGSHQASQVMFLTVFMAISWATEVISLAYTSLLPLVFLPIFGIVPGKVIAPKYFPNTSLLIFGASLFSYAVEKYELHRRFALGALSRTGHSPKKLILTFMSISAFISMWLSNTSTCLLIMPIAVSIVDSMQSKIITKTESKETETRDEPPKNRSSLQDVHLETIEIKAPNTTTDAEIPNTTEKRSTKISPEKSTNISTENDPQVKTYKSFRTALVLSIAYSCTLGGMSTLTGTGTNLAFHGLMSELYPELDPISFGKWFSFGFPLSVTLVISLWGYFCCAYLRGKNADFSFLSGSNSYFKKCLSEMGPITRSQKILIVDFFILIFLWFTRKPGFAPGWASWFGAEGDKYITDGTVVIACVFPLFIIQRPTAELTQDELRDGKPVPMLDVEAVKKAPWPVILLLGGGFALAAGFGESGLSVCIAGGLSGLSSIPYFGMLVILCLTASFMSEFISNVSTCSILVPIVAALTNAMRIDPLSILIPLALSCSCSFMLPVSTPPNSVAYGTGYLSSKEMIQKGFVLNIAGFLLVFLLFALIGLPIFNVKLDEFPSWAESAINNTATGDVH